MEEKDKKQTHYRVESISNAQMREKISVLPKDRLLEFAYEAAKACNKHEKQLEKQQSEIDRLKKQIEELQKPKVPVDTYAGYPAKKDYIAKLRFILERNKRPMSFDEIAEAFFKLESDLDEKWRNPNKSISKIISRAVRFRVVNREKKYGGFGEYRYKIAGNQ